MDWVQFPPDDAFGSFAQRFGLPVSDEEGAKALCLSLKCSMSHVLGTLFNETSYNKLCLKAVEVLGVGRVPRIRPSSSGPLLAHRLHARRGSGRAGCWTLLLAAA